MDVPSTSTAHSSSRANLLDHSLTALTDAERRDAARRERLQKLDRAHLASLEGNFGGTLTDLAEKRARTVLGLASGLRAVGEIVLLGTDVVELAGPRQSTLIGRQHIMWAQTQTDTSQRDEPAARRQITFSEVADEQFEAGDRLAVALAAHDAITGKLIAVGQDQITLRRDGDGDVIAVHITAIEQLGTL